MNSLFDIYINNIFDEMVKNLLDIVSIKSQTFHEEKRAERIIQLLKKNGFLEGNIKALKGNVIWTIGSKSAKQTILITAHIDEVGKNKNIRVVNNRIYGSGTWDNCASVIIAVYLSIFIRRDFNYKNIRLIFAATSREEGFGGLGGIKDVVEYYKNISCCIVLDGPYSFIANKSLFLRRYVISMEGMGGHSTISNGLNNLIVQGADLINEIESQIRKINSNIYINFSNIVSNKNNINEMPKWLNIKFEIRSEVNIKNIDEIIFNIVYGKDNSNFKVDIKCIDKREALELDKNSIIYEALNNIEKMGFTNKYVQVNSELDYMLFRNIDSIAVGVSVGGNAHMDSEFLEVNSLKLGMKKVYNLLKCIINIYETISN